MEMKKPKAVAYYNSNTGGVDLSDNLMVHFLTARNRLKKYYKKVFRHMLDMTLLNSYVTYKALKKARPFRVCAQCRKNKIRKESLY